MDEEVNEDLIKATIRRVTEARAAQTRAGEAESERSHAAAPAPVRDPNEGAIEAAIQRVADAKAAQDAAAGSPAEVDEAGYRDEAEDPIEATIRRVAEAKATQDAEVEAPAEVDEAGYRDEIEDPIEATIRRVAEAKAAQDAGGGSLGEVDETRYEDQHTFEDPIEATIRRVAAERAMRDAEAVPDGPAGFSSDPVEQAIALAETPTAWNASGDGVADPRPAASEDDADAGFGAGATIAKSGEETAWRSQESAHRRPRLVEAEPVATAVFEDGDVLSALRAELAATNARLDALVERVSSLASMLERVGGTGQRVESTPPTLLRPTPIAKPARHDDDWDDTPQMPRIPSGGPPRPAIIRDPSPMTATAEQLVDVEPTAPPMRLEPRTAPTAFEPAVRTERFAADLNAPRVDPAPPPAPVRAVEQVLEPEKKRGFDLLPKNYRITVEDKRRGVDLVPLHRALLGMDGVKDMSLLSYSMGVAIVAVETTNGIEPDALSKAVSRAMAREVKVEVHNDTTMVVKLAED